MKAKLSSLYKAAILPFAHLNVVQIYFDTATYDEIGRDVKVIGEWDFQSSKATEWYFHFSIFNTENYLKVAMEAALSLVGGTMGLLTGFSILSGIEIIFFVIKFLMSLRFRLRIYNRE